MHKTSTKFFRRIYSQLNRITKGHFLSSPMKIIQENNLAFLDNESGTLVKNDYLTPDEFYKELSTFHQLPIYLHINISSLPYEYFFTSLPIWSEVYLVENCKSKPKVIGIT